ncbi:MAG: type II CAAX prenyl endopeptidase Rce1 family protein [Candidatus Hermodarchaeota archaeon]
MLLKICSYCGKKTPIKNFCVFCGNPLSNINICPQCQSTIPINTTSCPFCTYPFTLEKFKITEKDSSHFNWIFTRYYFAILVIFLLSTYALTQILVGSIFLLLFPSEFFNDPIFSSTISLLIMLVSSTLLIIIIVKMLPFSLQEVSIERPHTFNRFLLLLILIVSISIIEIIVTLVDFGLNLINLDPSLSSPYDDYFTTPITILAFAFLAIIIGPVFEELVFRRFAISTMLKQYQSKSVAVCTSALIFSLAHTVTNLSVSLRYAILHLISTFILGIVLGIIFLRWGLKYAIVFHSGWNAFSLLVQILILSEAMQIIDLIIVLFICITTVFAFYSLVLFRTSLSGTSFRLVLPARNELRLVSENFLLIIIYEVILPFILLSPAQNIITAGFVFLYQFCGFFIGLKLITKEQRMSNPHPNNLIDLDAYYDDISSSE